MKNFKKIIAWVLAIAIFASMPILTFAINELPMNSLPSLEGNSTSEDTATQKPAAPSFGYQSGTVIEIFDKENTAIYCIAKDNEIVANIRIDEYTYISGSATIKTGDIIEVFYDANAPMIMIYPPQITAAVIIVNRPISQSVKVDKFDEAFLSSDGMLKLNISDKTEVILQDGTPYDGSIANRKLVVIYDIASKSIPAQTTPIKIVVLFEKIIPVTLPGVLEIGIVPVDIELINLNGEIVVENNKIDAPAPYICENGAVMVPLRTIAEALDCNVLWDNATRSVWLNNSASLTIGKDYYTFMKTSPVELGTAPELHNGYTYVPLSFFTEILKINNAYVFEGQIVIDNGELMQ